MGRKSSYFARPDKGWKLSWHYDGPLGRAMCGRSGNSTENINLVDCKECLKRMLKGGIIDEATYQSLRDRSEQSD